MNIHPDKPYSPACERNRDPILAALRPHFADRRRVLEIGSGTGQHAVHFAAALPHLVWQTSDRTEWLPGIRLWLAEAGLPNTPPPIELDVRGPWPAERFDAIFSANTLHIMGWTEVEALFAALPAVLTDDARLTVYGPFNYGGRLTSEINAARAQWHNDLKALNAGTPTGRDLDALMQRSAELDAATERLRRKHYPRAHRLIIGLDMASTWSKTGRSSRVVWRAPVTIRA